MRVIFMIIGLFIYTGVLGIQFNDALHQIRSNQSIPALKWLNWLNIIFLIGFFIFACGTIYLLLIDPTTETYNNAGQLMLLCLLDLVVLWLNGKLK